MPSFDLGTYMLIAIVAMAISMAIIPVMMRIAPAIGMVDKPDERKVHSQVIPRVGGVGIVVGFIVPLLIWLPPDKFVSSLLLGSAVLLLFGVWDDAKNLGPFIKLIGQFIAAIAVVYFGDVYIFHFPFMGMVELPGYIGRPLTIVAIVGMINALNLSDGLDGLAGGEALISFAAIAYMAYHYQSDITVIIALAAIGGIFGFLRFNSYPAKVFMGDGGSQTMGFILGALVVYLSQIANPIMSPAVPILLLGLPVIDALIVFYLRARRGDSLVIAAKDHLHHRLLVLGYYHYESVMLIYSIQVLFVICAILLPYESDYLLIGIYIVTSTLVFMGLTLAEHRGYRVHQSDIKRKDHDILPAFLTNKYILELPEQVLETGVMIFLIGAALMSVTIPVDIAASAAVLLLMLSMLVLVPRLANLILLRLVVFVSIGFAVYLSTSYPPAWLVEQHYLVFVFFALLTIAGFMAFRLSSEANFRITPLDYLVVIIALIIAVIPENGDTGETLTWMALQMIVLFYASELILQRMDTVRNRLSGSLIAMLSLVVMRGLL